MKLLSFHSHLDWNDKRKDEIIMQTGELFLGCSIKCSTNNLGERLVCVPSRRTRQSDPFGSTREHRSARYQAHVPALRSHRALPASHTSADVPDEAPARSRGCSVRMAALQRMRTKYTGISSKTSKWVPSLSDITMDLSSMMVLCSDATPLKAQELWTSLH